MKTMIKTNLLKPGATAFLLLLALNVVNAQVRDGNYEDVGATVTHHTAGKTVGFYAEPDVFYNPDYVDPGWALNPSSIWEWQFNGAPAAAHATYANYVEIATPAVGNHTVRVRETTAAAGCEGNWVEQTVVILPEPTMVVDAGGNVDLGDQCGDLSGHTINFNLTAEGLLEGSIWAQWRLRRFPVTIDGATGDPVVGAQDGADEVYEWDKYTSATTINGVEWTITDNGGFVGNGSDAPQLASLTLSMTRDYPVVGNAYLYRWVIDPGEGDGLNDRISRKSDYIDGGTSVYGTDGEIEIYVIRAPQTGPIYHIPNDFGN